MADLPNAPPDLSQQYLAHRQQSEDQAAYAQEVARVSNSQAAPAGGLPPTNGAPGASNAAGGPPAADGNTNPSSQEGGTSPTAGSPAAPNGPQQPQDHEAAIQSEMERLKAPPFDASRYDNPLETLRDQAISNLGLPSERDAAQEPGKPDPYAREGEGMMYNNQTQTWERDPNYHGNPNAPGIGAVAKDVAYGLTVEMPRAVLTGLHSAVQSVMKIGDESDKWLAGKLDDWHLGALNAAIGHDAQGFHVLSGEQAEQMKAAGTANEIQVSQHVPDFIFHDNPTTVTGNLIKGGTQFLAGLVLAKGQLEGLGLPSNVAGWAGRGVSAARGFVAGAEVFDGSQQRLSDLIQQVPALRNPVTDFLSSKPGDTEWEGRAKTALEGTVLSEATDGIISGIRMLRAAGQARAGMQDVLAAHAAQPLPGSTAGIEALGDVKAPPDAPIATIVTKEDAAAAKVAAQEPKAGEIEPGEVAEMAKPAEGEAVAGPASPGATEAEAREPGVYINFNRIDTNADIKRSISDLATAFKDDIDTARRGVQSFSDTMLGASGQDAWKVLMDRRQGEPLNDQESVAVRQLWATSASKTMELANIAADSPSPENLFAFRRQLATHAAIQQEVIAARTETARALSSWRIPIGTDSQRLQSMVSQLASDGDMRGGMETALDMAQRVRALSDAGDVPGLGDFVEKSLYAKSRDAVLETWTNMLLTNPLTHVKVTLSNAATVALRMAERGLGSQLSRVLGDTDGVAAGEAAAQYAGLVSGLKDSFRYVGKVANSLVSGEGLPELGNDPLSNAIKSAKVGEYTLEREKQASEGGGSEYLQNQGAVSSQALGISNSGWLGQGVDLMGSLIRVPGRALTGEHDFFRSIGYRMELHSLAVRQATEDVTAGRISQDAAAGRVAELVANPPPNLHIAAVDGTMYQTFTDAPGKIGELIGKARNEVPALKVILPFYKIPSRIMSFSLERSPLAPLLGAFRQNYAAGGARQALAVAQMGLGTSMMLATADAVLSGQMTGSGPPQHGIRAAMENEGWQPYSIKTSDGHWIQYNRLETAGSAMAMAADAVEAIKNFHDGVNGDDPDVSNLAVATTAAVANDITSKSYLQGLSNFFEAMASPKQNANRALSSLAGSSVPAGIAAIDRVTDPYKRGVYGMIDAIKARTPGASEGLPPVRNLWGEPVENASGMGKAYDLMVPAATREPANEPIDKELIKQGINISRVSSRTAIDGATLDLHRIDPKIYDRYQELAGNAYKDPGTGLGLKDSLNALVTGQHPMSPIYDMYGAQGDGPDGHKADMIKDMIQEYRNGAKQQLLSEFSGRLDPLIQSKNQAKAALHTPGQ